MSDGVAPSDLPDVPTFSECVLGYRAWRVDKKDQLWPLVSNRRPWIPGVNTARCNCGTTNSLKFEWSWHGGRRVLEPSPEHAAPESACVCGLYSWRRPPRAWYRQPELSAPPSVIGAVASWGRMQVHDRGFRAEYACVVTLAYDKAIGSEARQWLERIAARYGVEVVLVEELEEAASVHGTPLPDSLRPPEGEPPSPASDTLDEPDPPVKPAIDEEEQSALAGVAAWARRTPVAPLVGSQRRIGLRWRILFLALECCFAFALALLAVVTYQSQTRSDFVQQHGVRVAGHVSSLNVYGGCVPLSEATCYGTQMTVTLNHTVDRIKIVGVSYPRTMPLRLHQTVRVVLDPRHPSYAELARQPRASSGIWLVGVILAALALAVAILDGRRVLRLARYVRKGRKRPDHPHPPSDARNPPPKLHAH